MPDAPRATTRAGSRQVAAASPAENDSTTFNPHKWPPNGGAAIVHRLDVPMVVELKTDVRPLTHNDRMHWRKRAIKVKTIRQVTAAHATAAHIPPCDHIVVTLHYAPGDRASVTDSPNLTATSKPAIDGLVDARVVPNDTDRHVREVMPVTHPGPGPRRLWLEIEVTR